MKKLILFGGLLIVLFSMTGCVDCIVGGIMDETFGWIPGYEGSGCTVSSSSSSSSGNQITGNAVREENDNSYWNEFNEEGGIFDGLREVANNFNARPSDALAGNRLDDTNLPIGQDPCGNDPHIYFDGLGCSCDGGYRLEGKTCVKDIRECTFDQDCSPSGSDKMVCDGDKYSLRYRCDLRTYKCIPRKGVPAERVNCEAEFGEGYRCYGGSCVRY